ncbi:MAG: hypothetical protein AAB426_07305, partial [Myxococcota bacterium]
MRPIKHGPNKLDDYLRTHDTVMGQFHDAGFLCNSDLAIEPLHRIYRMRGGIACLGGIIVTVDKFLEEVESGRSSCIVQTVQYRYNVSVDGAGNVMRYDNVHSHPGHGDSHHCHRFDWQTDE